MQQSHVPPAAAPPVVPRHVVPPPVVPPPICHEVSPNRVSTPVDFDLDARPSFLSRVMRDIRIGGVCLAIGLIAGQSGVRIHFGAPPSSSVPSASKVMPLVQSEVDATIEPQIDLQATSRQETTDPFDLHDLQQELTMVDRSSPRPQIEVYELGPVESVQTTDESDQAGSIDDPDLVARSIEATKEANEEPAKTVHPPSSIFAGKKPAPPTIEPLATLSPTKTPHPQCEQGTCGEGMQSLGTELRWADLPADAYRMARQQGKLVFLIHVSGNFKIPGFT